MIENSESLSTLVVQRIRGEATPSQEKQLEEWSSLSLKNREWLNRFNDPEWVSEQIDIYNEGRRSERTEQNRIEMWLRIKEGEANKK